MDQYFSHQFAELSGYLLSGLVAAGLFFIMVGVRELNVHHTDGFLYLVLGVFFFACHFYMLSNNSAGGSVSIGSSENLVVVWTWLARVFAPALILLFLMLGIYNFVITRVKAGLIKVFFGVSLTIFIFWLGQSWSVDIKGILTLVWTLIWFDVELETETA